MDRTIQETVLEVIELLEKNVGFPTLEALHRVYTTTSLKLSLISFLGHNSEGGKRQDCGSLRGSQGAAQQEA